MNLEQSIVSSSDRQPITWQILKMIQQAEEVDTGTATSIQAAFHRSSTLCSYLMDHLSWVLQIGKLAEELVLLYMMQIFVVRLNDKIF